MKTGLCLYAAESEDPENRGKTLYHDFVVVAFSSVTLKYEDGHYVAAGKLPDAFVEAQDLAVAA